MKLRLVTSYHVAPANRRTFQIPPIKKLLKRYCGPVPGKSHAVDPFKFPYTEDALEYLSAFKTGSVKLLLLDPPYSKNQLKVSYGNKGNVDDNYIIKIKNESARIMAPGSIVISFGWNTTGLGKTRGFIKQEIMVINHGGQHYDTLVLVELKNNSLDLF